MASFKDYIKSDLNAFINPDEFGELHIIGEKKLTVILDYDQLERRTKYDGISMGEILYYARKSDIGKRPEEGMPQKFDGRQMFVSSCKEDNGMYEIILSQNRGG